jgi:hypothetical protein
MANRIKHIPNLVGRAWEEVAKELWEFLYRLKSATGTEPEPANSVTVLEEAGDLLTLNTSLDATRQEVGSTTGMVLITDLTKVTKLAWESITTWLGRILTAKGDLLSHNGTIPTKLAVGTNNKFLVAASGEATGLKWENFGVDAKGEMWAHDGTNPVVVPASTFPKVLRADVNATPGVKFYQQWEDQLFTTLADNTLTDIFDITVYSGYYCTLKFYFSVFAYGGGTQQLHSGVLEVRATYTAGGTWTVRPGDPVETDVWDDLTAGTLTVTWAASTSGSAGNPGVLILQCTANSSIGSPTIELDMGCLQVSDSNFNVVPQFTP